ncbi:MAG: hypothetical protein ACM34C_00850 [Syntrophaceae bacterium]
MKDMMQLNEKETPNWETAMKTMPFSGSRAGGTLCDVDGAAGFMAAAIYAQIFSTVNFASASGSPCPPLQKEGERRLQQNDRVHGEGGAGLAFAGIGHRRE